MGIRIDLTGQDFGKLHVIMLSSERATTARKDALWVCRCSCEDKNIVLVPSNYLKSGRTKSCGCYRREIKFKHGESGTLEYSTWKSMIQRCYNIKSKAYPHYGGRGIEVCDRWRESIHNFIEDMGSRESKNITLDRIDADGDYTPQNCQWLDKTTQVRKRKKWAGCTSKYKGATWIKSQCLWGCFINITKGKSKNLGTFRREVDAALAYDDAARELGYEEKWLNFPLNNDFSEEEV